MPRPYAPQKSLVRVGKAKKNEVKAWKEGRHLESSTGRTIEELRDRAVADRLALAGEFKRRGDRMLLASPPMYRDAISRYYYAMYHAMRAVVFFAEGGDDHQEHKVFPDHTPKDFEDAALWQNALKDARERRNAADYELYPKADSAMKRPAQDLQADCASLVKLCRSYARTKGCKFV